MDEILYDDKPTPRCSETLDMFDQAFDGDDRPRLTGQIKRVYACMADGAWRTLDEIHEATGDPQASISAQLRHLRKERFGAHVVEKRHRGDPAAGLYEYRVLR